MQIIRLESENNGNDLHDLKQLARGPDKNIVRYAGCMINGHRFRTIERDIHKTTQNSGVVVKGDHNGTEINFFGVLNDVIELSYVGNNKVYIFKCDWWDVGHRSRIHIDEFDILSVNVTRTWYKDDPYILASQAEEVIYIPDTKFGKNWRVVERMQPRNLYDENVMIAVGDEANEPFQQEECSDIGIEAPGDEMVLPLNRTDMDDIAAGHDAGSYEATSEDSFHSDDLDDSSSEEN